MICIELLMWSFDENVGADLSFLKDWEPSAVYVCADV